MAKKTYGYLVTEKEMHPFYDGVCRFCGGKSDGFVTIEFEPRDRRFNNITSEDPCCRGCAANSPKLADDQRLTFHANWNPR
jgi:hypothetical protein